MNEIELLRNQLATERRHVREVASACAAAHLSGPAAPGGAALAALRGVCAEYLGCVLDWFDQRDERLGELYARVPAGEAGRRALAAPDLSGRGHEALERLGRGGAAHERWQAVAQFINGAWDARRDAIEAALAANLRVADWRTFARVDADSVCQERALYARVRAALPEGVRLA
jgi:hypothetical protein